MKVRLCTAIVGLLFVGVCGAVGKDAGATVPLEISLDEACGLALESNPGINSIREQLVQQDGVLREAKALSRPHVSASGRYETYDDDSHHRDASMFALWYMECRTPAFSCCR